MGRTGFVLAGGRSIRMGRDKALLPYRGITLLEHVAKAVQDAAGACALIADPDRYGGLGYPVQRDLFAAQGPLGGLYTALSVSNAEWNLVVACDMPGVSVPALTGLLDAAADSGRDCIAALGSNGEFEPLCAVYHRRCLSAVKLALEAKQLKMRDLLAELDTGGIFVEAARLSNVNTPGDWAAYQEKSQ